MADAEKKAEAEDLKLNLNPNPDSRRMRMQRIGIRQGGLLRTTSHSISYTTVNVRDRATVRVRATPLTMT